MLDVTKPVQTRNGLPARILCTDLEGPNGRTMVVAHDEILAADGETYEFIGTRYADGRVHLTWDTDIDVVNVPDTISVNRLISVLRRVEDKSLPVFINVNTEEAYDDDCYPLRDIDAESTDCVRLSFG